MTNTGESVEAGAVELAAGEEVRAWYAERLRPKLQRAAQAGRIHSGHAVALDRDMQRLLDGLDADADAAARAEPARP